MPLNFFLYIIGWHKIDQAYFPSKGMFYPHNTTFQIKAAGSKEIRQYSAINEEDPFSIEESLNNILITCFSVDYDGRVGSWKDLLEEDRIFIILAIRDLTFAKGENKLTFKVNCTECDHENEFEVRNGSFDYKSISEKLTKYYDSDRSVLAIRTKDFGNFDITPPTVGVMHEVTKYIKEKTQNRRKIDQSFVKILPYLVQEWRGLNQTAIKNLEIEYMGWSPEKFNFMFDLVEMVQVSVKEEMIKPCEKCSAEVAAPVQFPGGLKSLFVVSDISGQLL